MAAMLRPSPVGSLPQHTPAWKGVLRYTTKPPPREPDFETMKPTGDVHEVIIAIEEDDTTLSHRIPPPPPAHTAPSFDPTALSFRLQAPTPPLALRPATPVSLTMSSPSATSPSPSQAASPTTIRSSPRSQTSSSTLVRNGSTASIGPYSPVMRSMFPRHDPTIPLTQQPYYPRVDVNPAVLAFTRRLDNPGSYSPSLYSQQEPPSQGTEPGFGKIGKRTGLGLQNLGGPSERSMDLPGISTPVELVEFWALANGQRSSNAARDFTLELSW